MDAVSVEIPGKINLTLEILGLRRSDGYHLLRSLVMPVGVTDTVTVRSSGLESQISCAVEGEGVDCAELGAIPLEKQLAVKAAVALRAACGVQGGVDISIVKRIPIGAGMGGGSADAAGTLWALNRLWGLGWSAERLAEVGVTVGSDVAALTLGGAVKMEGAGEAVSRVTVDGKMPWVVIVFPGHPVCTKRAYGLYADSKAFNDGGRDATATMGQCLASGDVEGVARGLYNDLQAVIFKEDERIRAWRDALLDAGAMGALLSGSGSAVFGVTADKCPAEEIARKMRERSPGTWVRAVPMCSQTSYF